MRLTNLLQNNPGFFISYFVFMLIGGILLFVVPKTDLVIFINQQHNLFLDRFFYYITFFGNGWFFVSIILFLFYRYPIRYGILGTITFACTSGIAQLLKHFVFDDYLRPKKLLEGIYELHFVQGVDVHSYYSFPSGHTVTAFAIFCLLSLIQKNNFYGMIYFLFALLTGISRIYLGQHFFTDVYVGAVLGTGISFLLYYFFEKTKGYEFLRKKTE